MSVQNKVTDIQMAILSLTALLHHVPTQFP